MHGVVVGLDGSAGSIEGLRWAMRRASELIVPLHVMTAVPPPVPMDGPGGVLVVLPDPASLRRCSQRMQVEWVRRLESEITDPPMVLNHVVVGSPYRVLRDAAADARLLVLGAGRRGRRWSKRLRRRVACPVIAIGDRGNPL